jgi:hypothetical protein
MNDADLHAEFYELKGKFEMLSDNVIKLTEQVHELNKTLNQSRGAWLVLLAFPTIIGGLAAGLGYFGIKIAFGQN